MTKKEAPVGVAPGSGAGVGRQVAPQHHSNNRANALASNVVDHDDLEAIAARVRDRLQRHTSDMVAIGADLVAVKEMLEHGEFSAWIEREFGLTARSAQLYMRAAEWAEGKSEIVSRLQPSALRLLSAPTTPPAIQEEVVEAIRAGEDVDFKEVETRVKEKRFAQREEKRRQSRRSSATSDTLKRREQRLKREAAEAEQRREERRLLINEVKMILEELPADRLARLLEINSVSRYLILADVLPTREAGR